MRASFLTLCFASALLIFFRPAAAAAVLSHRLRSSSLAHHAGLPGGDSAAQIQLEHLVYATSISNATTYVNVSKRAGPEKVTPKPTAEPQFPFTSKVAENGTQLQEPDDEKPKNVEQVRLRKPPQQEQRQQQQQQQQQQQPPKKSEEQLYWENVHWWAAVIMLTVLIVGFCFCCGGRFMRFILITFCNACTCLLMPLAKCLDACVACCPCCPAPTRAADPDATRQHGEADDDLDRIHQEMQRDEFDQSMCPICLEPLRPDDDADIDMANETTQLPCRHKFHERCIQDWAIKNGNRNCPLCRSDVTQETLIEADRRKPESYQRRLKFYLARLRERHPEQFSQTVTNDPLYSQNRDGRWAMAAVPVAFIGGFMFADTLTHAHSGAVGDSSGGGGMIGDMFPPGPGEMGGDGGFGGGAGGCGGGCGGG